MKAPLAVILISCLFILSGISGIIYHWHEWATDSLRSSLPAFLVRLLAIVAGVFTLRGSNLARWTLVVWIIYHVALSITHSMGEAAMHVVISIITCLTLFNTKANHFFKKAG